MLGASAGLEIYTKILVLRIRILVLLILARARASLYLALYTLYKF